MKLALKNTNDILRFTESKLNEMGYEFKHEPLRIVNIGEDSDL